MVSNLDICASSKSPKYNTNPIGTNRGFFDLVKSLIRAQPPAISIPEREEWLSRLFRKQPLDHEEINHLRKLGTTPGLSSHFSLGNFNAKRVGLALMPLIEKGLIKQFTPSEDNDDNDRLGIDFVITVGSNKGEDSILFLQVKSSDGSRLTSEKQENRKLASYFLNRSGKEYLSYNGINYDGNLIKTRREIPMICPTGKTSEELTSELESLIGTAKQEGKLLKLRGDLFYQGLPDNMLLARKLLLLIKQGFHAKLN